jgi:hypothetical protein
MKLQETQPDKYTTMTEITFTPKEAVQVIEGLAAGIRAVSMEQWNNYCSGTFYLDVCRSARIRVEQE